MNYLKSINDEVLEFLENREGQYMHTKDFWSDGVLKVVRGESEKAGDLLPWVKTHDVFRLRPGEVTIWAGINGHKKSMLSGMVALWLSRHTKTLIASLEMTPEDTLVRMLRQAAGCDDVTEGFAERFLAHDTDSLWLYDQLDTVPTERILGMIHLAARKYHIKHIFIDSLMKCGIGTDDYTGQKNFVDSLCWAAKSEGIHIHLVHHVRKGERERMPNKFDVRGASEIVDLVDNLLIVYSNKEAQDEEPDVLLDVAKQRHGSFEGMFKFWFHEKSLQFLPDRFCSPMIYRMEVT